MVGIIVLALLAVGGYFGYQVYLANRQSSQPSKASAETHAIFAPQTTVYQTQYFQFQADKHWAFIASESNDTKYVYRSLRNTIVEHDLTITINGRAAANGAPRVLPVTIDTDNTLKPEHVSDQCAKQSSVESNPHRVPQEITFMGVQFLCNPDTAALYEVVVGLKGGTAPMQLKRANGTPITIGIYYRNLKSDQTESEILSIINTFQTR